MYNTQSLLGCTLRDQSTSCMSLGSGFLSRFDASVIFVKYCLSLNLSTADDRVFGQRFVMRNCATHFLLSNSSVSIAHSSIRSKCSNFGFASSCFRSICSSVTVCKFAVADVMIKAFCSSQRASLHIDSS